MNPSRIRARGTIYVATVSQPFIQDVLEGAGELRIAGSASLGVLLKESLERRAFAPEFTDVDTFAKLGTRSSS